MRLQKMEKSLRTTTLQQLAYQPGYHCLAQLLHDAGYHTLLSGKWHLACQSTHPGAAPFDRAFEKSLTLPGDGANHFNDREYVLGWPVIFQESSLKGAFKLFI
jgi:arylsulfatase A-like enzyme